jgi:outer membrane receptor protein involved in Fe transport
MTVQDEALGVCRNFNLLSQAIADALRGPKKGRALFTAASGGALLGAVMLGAPTTPASAQEVDESVLDTIVVTGSRIPRRDFSANAPIMTVDEGLFNETSAIGAETILNQMPQFVPAVTQFTTNDVRHTATNTVGVSTVSLRGLGPNRNLVLVNGKRVMPVSPTMVVDTNSIPTSAIARVEVISGGASAVYGADAVGGVVNFVLKDDFEGASVDVRFADTQHGGNQEMTVSGLLGANVAGDRGNVMFGVERSTRSKQRAWERDWRLADYANGAVRGELFVWGGLTWVDEEYSENGTPFVDNPADPGGPQIRNLPTQAGVDAVFAQYGLAPGTVLANTGTNYNLNTDGTMFTGMGFNQWTPGRVEGIANWRGPVYGETGTMNGGTGDLNGDFAGLPVYVRAPNGYVKENNLYSWVSAPLERHSAFATGHFDVSDSVRVTAQASFTRTQTESSLGQTAANLNQWAGPIPFGNEQYRGDNRGDLIGDAIDSSIFDIPDPLIDNNGNGIPDLGDETHPAYLPGGRFGVNCEAQPSAAAPWADGLPGCTMTEAWPVTPDVWTLMRSRPDPDAVIWVNRPADYLRSVTGSGRSTTNTTSTMQLSLGLEGDLPSGNDFWDITLSTGRTDNAVQQRGSVRLTTYRELTTRVPNSGRGAVLDPNPTDEGFAESNPTCETGLPLFERFIPSQDCVDMIMPSLKNEREVTQTIFEANLVGDLVEMPAGPLQYALGLSYRENSFYNEPDNLVLNNNFIDILAGTYPQDVSLGEFDVKEIYGELLIPLVSNGPTGVEHFSLELGARVSDWSMPNMPTLETYKALIDWGITDRYRIRGGWNRAFRAPNLGELFIGRTQSFTGRGTKDFCSKNLDDPLDTTSAHFSATPLAGAGAPDDAQSAQTEALCRLAMGESGAFEYYDNRPLGDQPTLGNTGVSNSIGNPDLREEKADTLTLGVVMDFHDNMTLTADWYEIEITDMISLIRADAMYQLCADLRFNPTGDPNAPYCGSWFRNSGTGNAAGVDRAFSNQARALMAGVDLQFNWSRPLGAGNFTLNTVANYALKAETQEQPILGTADHVGYDTCSVQIQCQRYEYRLFTTLSYFKGPWNIGLRHQYWPGLKHDACRNAPRSNSCLYDSWPNYQLVALTGGFTFADRYRVNFGIENLFDEDPPCIGADPDYTYWSVPCSHGGGEEIGNYDYSTYDPLGRRFYVSMTMDF